jgi:lysyl-tRNA synthetase class 1
MFWADRITGEIKEHYTKAIAAGNSLIIRDEKTASGRVHVGSMRGVAIHGIIDEILHEQNVPHTFFYEINDFDPMDGLPVYLDEATFKPHLGKPLLYVPSPDGKAKNFAEYFAEEYKRAIEKAGFTPTYYRSSELYLSGRMNECIRIALEKAADIRRIYLEASGSKKAEDWLPLNVICENCGKVSTTKVTDFDGSTVAYHCYDLEWTNGCDHEGRISPFDGKAKLPWKVEWAAKFKVVDVSVEGGGKDHATKGGSRDVANRISKEVFGRESPFDIPYEFFLIEGKKMSSSKGRGSSAVEMAELLPTKIFRLALLGKDINQQINFKPEGDTIPVLFDTYDRLAESYWNGTIDDQHRLFTLVHTKEERASIEKRYLPRFSLVAFLVQMPHLDVPTEVAKMKGEPLTALDQEELALREATARFWLQTYAPEEFKYEIQKTLPEVAQNLTAPQKEALRSIVGYLKEHTTLDGQTLHTELHELRKQSGLEPKDFFGPIYRSILGKESGPKAGWFLSVLDHTFLLERLQEASS